MSGHFSVAKTEALLLKDYYIPNVRPKIEKIVKNCVTCILAERKQGKQEGYLNTIEKGELPLDTYHVDHLGPLPSTKKSYKYVFLVIDAFTKFVWLYATKTTNIAEVLSKLKSRIAIRVLSQELRGVCGARGALRGEGSSPGRGV